MRKEASAGYLCIALLLLPFCSSDDKFHTVGIHTFKFKTHEGHQSSIDEETILQEGGIKFPVKHNHAANFSAWMNSVKRILAADHRLHYHYLDGKENRLIPIRSGNRVQAAGYTVVLGIGTPSQKALLTLDTANALSWIHCHPCLQCGKQAYTMFDPKKSISFKQTKCKNGTTGSEAKCPPLGDPTTVTSICNNHESCTFEVDLADGTNFVGDYVTETLRAGEFLGNFHMGCTRQDSGNTDETSGILALSRSPLSLPSQKYGGVFSFCLPNFLSQRAKGSLLLGKGSIPPSIKNFTPIQTNPNISPDLYLVGLEAISVGIERIDVPQHIGGLETVTIIESANLLSRLIAPLYDSLKASFLKQTGDLKKVEPVNNLDTCFQIADVKGAKIPKITFHFKGNVSMDVKNIGTLLLIQEGVACFAFVPTGPDQLVSVIGNAQLQGITVAFDNAKNQIGFVPDSC